MRISNRIVSNRATVCIEFQGEHYAVDSLWTLHQKNAEHAGDLSPAAAGGLPAENFLVNADSVSVLNTLYHWLMETHTAPSSQAVFEQARIPAEAGFAPPIMQPPLMFGLAGNCAQFWRKAGGEIRNYPVGYVRPWSSLVGHGDRVKLAHDVTTFRCAAELGVIIGRPAANVAVDEAREHIFGYTIVNDMIGNQWKDFAVAHHPERQPTFYELLITSYYGRGSDGFAPTGPIIVTRDEIQDPYNLQMFTSFNGEVRDRSYTSAMIVGIEQAIAYLSQFMTLQPGSIIHMGTMGIDGITIDNNARLSDEDRVEIEIEKIGKLGICFEDHREVSG